MVDANLIHALGESGASKEYVAAVMAAPNDARNHALGYAQSCRAVTDAEVFVPSDNFPALRALWHGDVATAYREADANLAIVLEEAFAPRDLGLPEVSCIEYDYDLLTTTDTI